MRLAGPVLFFIVFVLVATYVARFGRPQEYREPTPLSTPIAVAKPCVPTFADGGGPYYKLGSPLREKIVPEKNTGIHLIVSGKVLRSDCSTPIAEAILDIWQANESGSYQDEWYRGKVRAGKDGSYRFETIVPKGYGEGTGYRPPHIHFKVIQNDQVLITSQMFFPDAVGWTESAYILKIEERLETDQKVLYGVHDIIVPL